MLTKPIRFVIINLSKIRRCDMVNAHITLKDVQAVRDFVRQVILLDYEVDLVQGRYIVDAKSIMGIFALDTLSPITLVAHTDNADEFLKRIDSFLVK
jgi:phosphotransferase system HPr-like phosphotransfer protein